MLRVDGLTKTFGSVTALEQASFEAHPGRIVGFLGPNGAGKTTAMRCIFGLVQADSGQVLWNDQPVTTSTRLQFGYMPEERGLYPKMAIGEQLRYLGRLSGMEKKAAAEAAEDWLSRLGLGGRASAKVEQLSHGNKQRVQLAAALVHGPTLAVLDEPFAGLDPLGTDALASELRNLAAQGTTILFSSHQLDLVQDVCQDVVVIHQGCVVRTGTLDELRSGSAVRRLAVEVDGRPWRPNHVEALPALSGTGTGTDHHVLLPVDVAVDTILAQASSAGTITSLRYEPPSLSDIFREAVAS
jgi:ABC-2 type transport system ATP-binding protein